MEKIQNLITEHRKISSSSLHIYSVNMNKLAKDITGTNFVDTKFLHDIDKVLDAIKDKSLTTRKNYLTAALVFLNPTHTKFKDHDAETKAICLNYIKTLKSLQRNYYKEIEEQKKSTQQEG